VSEAILQQRLRTYIEEADMEQVPVSSVSVAVSVFCVCLCPLSLSLSLMSITLRACGLYVRVLHAHMDPKDG
jgi:hypothetical protein